MEPNKFDNEIREKLAQRSIEPTPMAWDRLDAMLSVAEKGPKKKFNRTWMYMAACFLALLLAGTFFLNQSSAGNGNGIINSTNSVVSKGQGQPGHQHKGQPSAEPATTINNNTVPGAVAGTGSSSSSKNQNQRVQQQQSGGKEQQFVPVMVPSQPVAQNQATARTPRVNVDANALLASVEQSKPQGPKAAKQPQVRVDATALLSGAEGEAEVNYRGRMLDKLAKNYSEVKDAVATRNYN
jgi:hypothetical protein